ncbi:MAG TPA: hypothetical protein VIH76_17635 [Candidatus Acidoferrales bacterium]
MLVVAATLVQSVSRVAPKEATRPHRRYAESQQLALRKPRSHTSSSK